MTTSVRKPTAERREEIARAVLRIIGERGLTSLTTTSLAQEVGVTSGALFRHFPTLDDMMSEAVRYGLARIEETFPDESLPPLARLLELARARVHLLGSEPGLAWLLRSEEARLSLPAPAVGLLLDVVARSKRVILQALREGAQQGSVRADIEPEILMVPVMGTIQALVGMRGIHRLETDELGREPERVLAALVRLLVAPAASAQ
jgi:AcrR family transcriptional regulator